MRLYKVEIETNEGIHSCFFETYKEALRCRSSFEEEGYEDILVVEVKIPVTKQGILDAINIGISCNIEAEVYPKGTSSY
jgi:transaldolase|tara:strand:+ start:97 stop:333 length:237 start_codon:yes stop_codon:yes gene_type:complete